MTLRFALFFLSLVCLVYAAPVWAQDAAPQPQAMAKSTNLYSKVPDEYLREAEQFHQRCEGDSRFNYYYNCECLAVKFLDIRIKEGPNLDASSIMIDLQGECHDATQAAGYEYQRCYELAELAPKNMDLEKYCSCTANTYAKLFESTKLAPNSQTFVELKSQASLYCQNPALAREFYPNLIIP